MSNSHIKTAHDWGVQEALKQAGYSSVDEVLKEAQALGLINQPQGSSPAPASGANLEAVFRSLKD